MFLVLLLIETPSFVQISKNAAIVVGLDTFVGDISSHEREDRLLFVTVTEAIFMFCMRAISQRLIGRRVK